MNKELLMNKKYFPDQMFHTISGNTDYNISTPILRIIQYTAHTSSYKRFLFSKYHCIRLTFIHHEDTLARLLQIYTDNKKQNDMTMKKKNPICLSFKAKG